MAGLFRMSPGTTALLREESKRPKINRRVATVTPTRRPQKRVSPATPGPAPVGPPTERSWRQKHLDWTRRLGNEPRDVQRLAQLTYWLNRGVYLYSLARSFLVAHSLGWVGRAERDFRIGKCNACPHLYRFTDNHEYCRGENNGKGCDCGHWPARRKEYIVTLAARKCPQGHYGYGRMYGLFARWFKEK